MSEQRTADEVTTISDERLWELIYCLQPPLTADEHDTFHALWELAKRREPPVCQTRCSVCLEMGRKIAELEAKLALAELAARTNAEGWKEALRWAGELQERTVRSLR